MRQHKGASPSNRRIALSVWFALMVAVSLVSGVMGGLIRAGINFGETSGAWIPRAVLGHAFLMASSFLGTVIGLERAVALKHPLAFATPLASGVAGFLMVAGFTQAATLLAVGAALSFVGVNVVVVMRQRAAHTALLLVAAAAWALGAVSHAAGGVSQGVISWWFAFLVLTIAAERLEMTRLMRRRRGASACLVFVLTALLLGSLLSSYEPTALAGGLVYGGALLALAVWLFAFDIARRTVGTEGLSRYMAVCLLLGYAWLGIAGAAWVGTTLGLPWRDAALHGVALGFVFSMIFGHAPVILPALTRLKLLFWWAFYVPLVLLHTSLLVRLLMPSLAQELMKVGAGANAASIVLFALIVAVSIFAWRRKYAKQDHHHAHSSKA